MFCALPGTPVPDGLTGSDGCDGLTGPGGLPEGAWRKSSYSSDANGSCVEWQPAGAGAVAVRDSKSPSLGAFRFTCGAWDAFLDGVKSGRLGG